MNTKSIVSESLLQNILAALNHQNPNPVQVGEEQKQAIIQSLSQWHDFVLSESKAPRIYQSLQEMQLDISRTGLSKSTEAKDSSGKVLYKARGIDDVYNLLSPLFAKHNIALGLKTLSRECNTATTKYGAIQYQTIITNEYEFISTLDGSKHNVTVIGEAFDTGDKGTAKAMSMAFKVACFQIFCIPVCDDPDSFVHDPNPIQSPNNQGNTHAKNKQQYRQNGNYGSSNGNQNQNGGNNFSSNGNNYQQNGNNGAASGNSNQQHANHSGNGVQSNSAINTEKDNSLKINQAQAQILKDTIRQAGKDPRQVLTHYKIQRFGELSLHRFNAIMKQMQTFISENTRIQKQHQQFNEGYHDQRNYS